RCSRTLPCAASVARVAGPPLPANADLCGRALLERCVARRICDFCRATQRSAPVGPRNAAFGTGGAAQRSVRHRWGRATQRSAPVGAQNLALADRGDGPVTASRRLTLCAASERFRAPLSHHLSTRVRQAPRPAARVEMLQE